MPILEWDNIKDRNYETGLDRGVLYLPDGSAVPWNGLTSVIEKFNKETMPVYYDGMKISDLVTLGDFSASMKALTYPDEFVEIEGMGKARNGVFFGDQPPKVFALCYRTKIGNAVEGDNVGYKIHIIYNVTAIPSDRTYASLTDSPNPMEFEWDITAIPEEVPGFNPTAHIILNSLDLDSWLLEELEEILYGSDNAFASLIPMSDLVTYINEWYRVKIIDNGDDTWTAISKREGFISFPFEELFEIVNVNVKYLDDSTFEISDTTDEAQVPEIKIIDNGDGTWTASTDDPNVISIDLDTRSFEIRDVNAIFVGNTYEISDTFD